jgi:hypothetical protein
MAHTESETLKLALTALKLAAAELYRASSYCNTYEVIDDVNDAITDIEKDLKQSGELEAKVALQPEEDLYDLAVKADNGGQP